MEKLFFCCLFVAAAPWMQAGTVGHAVIGLSSVHSGAVSVAPRVHTSTSTIVHTSTSNIVHVPQMNMVPGNANSFGNESRLLNDPLNTNPIVHPLSQQSIPSFQAPKQPVAPVAPVNPVPLGTTVETQTRTAANGYSVSQVRQVQTALHRLGYYNGQVDGDFGPNTQNALQKYQTSAGQPVTGTLSSGVLSRLGVNGAR
jgi:Putative peptidoglycan binding domain